MVESTHVDAKWMQVLRESASKIENSGAALQELYSRRAREAKGGGWGVASPGQHNGSTITVFSLSWRTELPR
jgi:hypothetical protein